MEITYIGEHLLPGKIGHIAVLLSFVGAIVATVSFFFATNEQEEIKINSWKKIGRVSFFVHCLSILAIFVALFYIISNHLFEYHYAWRHSSLQLPPEYLLSCFWEGQEGSFLLWSFWNCVLGIILIFTAKKWETPVMAVISLTQIVLASMLLGIYFFGYKVGSNPFTLLRNEMLDAPIFQRPNYLSFVQDGNGLNPLLQNYWMTIHPPTLFLGFASTVVPFAFAIAALWKNNFTNWLKPVLPWTLFACGTLALGVMMGAAWAYEALNFGGYWAWDPVENASIIPWLTLIGGLHTAIAAKSTGHALKTTFILFIATFLLILYATFLTRSGILGDSSVHAFTDLGMSGQLLIFIGVFALISVFLLIKKWKQIPSNDAEENTYSREFWIFIGALVFLISSVQILFTTSIPVINKIFSSNLAPPVNAMEHYNKWQLPIAIIIAFLSGFGLYLKFKNTDYKKFLKEILILLIIAAIVTIPVLYFLKMFVWHYGVLLFVCFFSVFSNGKYCFLKLKDNTKIHGASVAHLGFALMLIGILISATKQYVISKNNLGIDYGKGFDEKSKQENILLYKNIPSKMGEYTLTYLGDTTFAPNTYYKVHYEKQNEKGEITDEFTLLPNAQVNPKMGLIASPDTRHYLTEDIYTHVTSVPDKSRQDEITDDKFQNHLLKKGDTVFNSKSFVVLENLNTNPQNKNYQREENDIVVSAVLKIQTLDKIFSAEPIYLIRNNQEIIIEDEVKDLGLHFRFVKIRTTENKIELQIAEQEPLKDYIIMKAIVFPYINVLWLGTVVMIFGFGVSVVNRYRKNKKID